ncbi:hypothetical protein [Psychromonas sp. SA13A]|uniref:hypothetical protein n=1 Tax=Psychromonas sp. SA13A TaxID=2686346 RepID=UPI00140CDB8E|nr:hypothetical protein [Psychromonas sp. SA13A]
MELLFILLFSFLIILIGLLIECSHGRITKGQYSYLSILLIYQLFFSTWIGALIVALDIFNPIRLSAISYDSKIQVFYFVSYATLIIFISYAFFTLIKRSHYLSITQTKNFSFINVSEEKQEYYQRIFKVTIIMETLYVVVKYIVFYSSSPLLIAMSGDPIRAAIMRQSIQNSGVIVDLPYVGKFFYFLCLFNVIFYYFLHMLNNTKKSQFLFLFVFFLSCSNLLFDGQKAPLLLLFMMLFITHIQFKKINLKLISFIPIVIMILAFFYSMLMGGGDFNFTDTLSRAFDRIVAGQNQAMYFLYQFYEPKLTGVFTDLPFSGLLGLKEIKPDETILPYIYNDLSGLVNSNTFFQGEAWAFFGIGGVIFMPFLVSISLILYVVFFDYLMKFDFHLFWVTALIFFSTLPINQSLQFIVYQKYFLYFCFLFILPILFIVQVGIKLRFSR